MKLRGSNGIAVLRPDLGCIGGWIFSATPQPPYPRGRALVPTGGGWVYPMEKIWTDLGKRKIYCPHRGMNPGPCSLWQVAVPTTVFLSLKDEFLLRMCFKDLTFQFGVRYRLVI